MADGDVQPPIDSLARPKISLTRRLLTLFGLIGAREWMALPHDDDEPKRTARVIRLMLFIAIIYAVLLAIFASLTNEFKAATFVWSAVIAICAMLTGGALGILFGLPVRRQVDVRREPASQTLAQVPAVKKETGTDQKSGDTDTVAAAASAASSDRRSEEFDTGYAESTSLEQVADWLTKIIIGLTLTQYATWEDRYFDLSRSATSVMEISIAACAADKPEIGAAAPTPPRPVTAPAPAIATAPGTSAPGAGTPSSDASQTQASQPTAEKPSNQSATKEPNDCQRAQAIPGGMLMAAFALIGFIIAYFWMRRYFIFEMVTARDEEKRKYRQLFEVEIQKRGSEAAKQVAQADAEKAKAEAETAKTVVERLRASGMIVQSPPPSDGRTTAIASAKSSPQSNPVSLRQPNDAMPVSNAITTIEATPLIDPTDDWKGRAPEASELNGFNISAKVEAYKKTDGTLEPGLFDIQITVSTNEPSISEKETATFLIPASFGAQRRSNVFSAGKATLNVLAWGAFTVIAIMEDGTVLCLDLSKIGADPLFTQR